MNEMIGLQLSRHIIRNSFPGGLWPGALPFGHGGCLELNAPAPTTAAYMIYWSNVVVRLGHRRGRWPSINPSLNTCYELFWRK